MLIRLLFFGVLKESAHNASASLELPAGATVESLLAHLKPTLSVPHTLWSALAVAVNREYASRATILHEGDEVALLPPVSGGAR